MSQRLNEAIGLPIGLDHIPSSTVMLVPVKECVEQGWSAVGLAFHPYFELQALRLVIVRRSTTFPRVVGEFLWCCQLRSEGGLQAPHAVAKDC